MPSEGVRPPRSPQPTFFLDGTDFYRAPADLSDSNEHLPRSQSPSIFSESEAQQHLNPTESGAVQNQRQRSSNGNSPITPEAYRQTEAYRGTGEFGANSRGVSLSLPLSDRLSSSNSLAFRHSYGFRHAYPPSAFPDNGFDHDTTPNPNRPRRPSSEAMDAPRPFRPALADSSNMMRSSSMSSFAPPPAPWMRQGSDVGSWSSAPATPPPRLGTPRSKKPFTSNLLKGEIDKPWLQEKDKWATISWWITFFMIVMGFGASAVYCFFQYKSVPQLGNICLVLEDNFDTFDTNIWQHEVEVGGFGNGQFEWTTNNDANAFVEDGKLYLVPTLTEEDPGLTPAQLTGNFTLHLPSCNGTVALQPIPKGTTNVAQSGTSAGCCTSTNSTKCTAVANKGQQRMINPIQSARLTTRLSANITYGRVEVRAKLPKGDWMWPAIWMLPVQETYGVWPMSGEIDIMEARGNDASYTAQGRNYFTSALNWGPSTYMNSFWKTWGWRFERRTTYDADFHDYVLEWSPDFLWIYVDNRLKKSLDLRFDKQSFFQRGDFPPTITIGNEESVLKNPWAGRGNSAPFDQPFYLILNVAVGGTNGWFQNGVGNKPWLDQSSSAMADFYAAKDSWYSTWPQDPRERGMAVDRVRMYQRC